MCALTALVRRDAPGWREQLSPISCEVDYALGGGSSGATVRDGGVRSAITRRTDGATCTVSSVRVSAATKPAPHDAKSWQLVEAGVRSQGMLPDSCLSGAEPCLLAFALSAEPVMSIPLIPAISSPARALPAALEGARQVTPAPASTS